MPEQAEASGAANDPTVTRDQSWWDERRKLEREIAAAENRAPAEWAAALDEADRLRAELAGMLEPSPEEKARAERVAARVQELYALQSRVPGTREHAAHHEGLARRVAECESAQTAAGIAVGRAETALEGARQARENADAAAVEAAEALAAFSRDYGMLDGGAE